jgi:hypothetical protein
LSRVQQFTELEILNLPIKLRLECRANGSKLMASDGDGGGIMGGERERDVQCALFVPVLSRYILQMFPVSRPVLIHRFKGLEIFLIDAHVSAHPLFLFNLATSLSLVYSPRIPPSAVTVYVSIDQLSRTFGTRSDRHLCDYYSYWTCYLQACWQ